MIKESRFKNFSHPERQHLIDFCEFSNDHEAAMVHFFQGLPLEIEGRFEEAASAYRKSIELDSMHPVFYQRLGNVFAGLGEMDKAIAYNQQANGLYGWHLCGERDYQFPNNWFSENIPIWEEHLKPLAHQPAIQALEIGSHQGMSACWLLDNLLTHASARIICIDPFLLPYSQEFDDNIAKTGASAKVTKVYKTSQEALVFFKPGTYDFVYIDGDHDDDVVFQDGVFSWNLVKPGGLIVFDDYGQPTPEHNTQIGTDRFLSVFGSSVEVIHKAYQVIVKKVSNDNDMDTEALSDFRDILPQETIADLRR